MTRPILLINQTSYSEILSYEQLQKFNIRISDELNRSITTQTLIIERKTKDFINHVKTALNQKAQVFIISDEDDEQNVLELLDGLEVNHVIGKSAYISEEIIFNMLKFHRQNIWGVEKYLDEVAQVYSDTLNHSKDINPSVDSFLEQADFSSFFESPKKYLKVMYNELLTNAFFHMTSTPPEDRRESIFVSGEDSVNFKIGIDKNKLAISVKDNNIELKRDQIVKSLVRSFKEKSPNNKTSGAGLGLYLVFQHANQIVFNCSKMHGNEIIAIIDTNKRYLNYKKRVTSFHFFKEVEND